MLLPSSPMKVASSALLVRGGRSVVLAGMCSGDDGVGPVIGSLPSACTTAASSPAPTRPAAAIHKKNRLEEKRRLLVEPGTVADAAKTKMGWKK